MAELPKERRVENECGKDIDSSLQKGCGGGVLRVRDVRGEEIRQVKEFKYLATMLCERRGSSRDLQERVKAGWRKWGEVSAVMKDKRMGMRLKAKVYQTVVWPVLIYGAQCRALNKRDERRLEVTNVIMLRKMLGVTRRDRLRNKEVRERNRSPGEHCESSGEIKDEVVWACGEKGREGCNEKSNGLPSDGERNRGRLGWGGNKVEGVRCEKRGCAGQKKVEGHSSRRPLWGEKRLMAKNKLFVVLDNS